MTGSSTMRRNAMLALSLIVFAGCLGRGAESTVGMSDPLETGAKILKVDWKGVVGQRTGVGACAVAVQECHSFYVHEAGENQNEVGESFIVERASLDMTWGSNSPREDKLFLGIGHVIPCDDYCHPFGTFRFEGFSATGRTPLHLEVGPLAHRTDVPPSLFVYVPPLIDGQASATAHEDVPFNVTGTVHLTRVSG